MIIGTQASADLGIPSPATIVRDASSIVVGTLEHAGGAATFRTAEVVKGPAPGAEPIAVAVPGPIIGFDLAEAARRRAGHRVLLLGTWDEPGRRFVLDWYSGSIWPPSVGVDTFPSETLAGCVRFVTAVLGYHRLGPRRAELVEALLADAQGPNPHAALDFMDVSLARYLAPGDARTLRQILWAGFASAIAAAPDDRHLERLVPSLLPMLPASLSVPWLLGRARIQRAPLMAQRALAARGAAPGGPRPTREEVERLFAQAEKRLRVEDAEFALSLFESPFAGLRDRGADLVLERIVGQPLARLIGKAPPGDPEARRLLWKEQIVLM